MWFVIGRGSTGRWFLQSGLGREMRETAVHSYRHDLYHASNDNMLVWFAPHQSVLLYEANFNHEAFKKTLDGTPFIDWYAMPDDEREELTAVIARAYVFALNVEEQDRDAMLAEKESVV